MLLLEEEWAGGLCVSIGCIISCNSCKGNIISVLVRGVRWEAIAEGGWVSATVVESS